MALTVVVRSGDVSSPPQITFDAPRIVIGRGDGCEVRLPDPSISHRHASIRQRGTDYIVIDEGSTNGTFVGPVRLSPQAPRVLRSGDLLRVGRIWLEIRIEQVAPTQNPQLATKELALLLVAEALAAQGDPVAPRVTVLEGPDAGRQLSIAQFERPHVIGRGKNLDLTLEDVDASRRHVEVLRRGAHLYLRELGSKNGSRLDGIELLRGKELIWPKGAVLELGKNRMSYEDPVTEALAELERAADERMRDDDSIEPPAVLADSSSTPAALDEAAGNEALPASKGREASIAALPKRLPTHTRKNQINITDLVVAAIALLVLAVSIVGLLWLFRSE